MRTTYKALPPDQLDELENLLERVGDLLDELEGQDHPSYPTYKGLHDMLGDNALMAGTATPPPAKKPVVAPVGILPKKRSDDHGPGLSNMPSPATITREKARQQALNNLAAGGPVVSFFADLWGRQQPTKGGR